MDCLNVKSIVDGEREEEWKGRKEARRGEEWRVQSKRSREKEVGCGGKIVDPGAKFRPCGEDGSVLMLGIASHFASTHPS